MYYKEGNKVNEVAGANPEALTVSTSPYSPRDNWE